MHNIGHIRTPLFIGEHYSTLRTYTLVYLLISYRHLELFIFLAMTTISAELCTGLVGPCVLRSLEYYL